MKTVEQHRHVLAVSGTSRPPVVEIDTEAGAAYVRFNHAKVAKTVRQPTKGAVVTVDLDQKGEVIGVEFVGVSEFSIRALLRMVPVQIGQVPLERTKYVSTQSKSAGQPVPAV